MQFANIVLLRANQIARVDSDFKMDVTSYGNRTEVIGLSPLRSVIIRVITKSDDRAAGVRLLPINITN